MPWLYVAVAIVSEVIATSARKASNEFTRLWPSVVVVAGCMSTREQTRDLTLRREITPSGPMSTLPDVGGLRDFCETFGNFASTAN